MIEQKLVNTLRKLALDEIAEANSGHPGIALGIAPMLFAVFKNAKLNPKNPTWFNRDRIVLSAGHGSSVLYSTLHLFGFDVSIDDLKNFRKLGSKTPGHPEVGVTDGVDASTGALGQGFATAVGMAMAQVHLQEIFGKENKICDHNTFVVCGDGDLMEGISYEAASLAGKFGLNKLIALYDSNGVTMTDKLSITSTEDTAKRFEASGWNVLVVKDGENFEEIETAIKQAKKSKNKPSIIICNTTIGFGSKLAGKSKCHGSPFKKDEVAEICKGFALSDVPFYVDEDVKKLSQKLAKKDEKDYEIWKQNFDDFKAKNPKLFKQFFGKNDAKYQAILDKIKLDGDLAGRASAGKILNILSQKMGNFFGGGADVATSTMAYLENEQNFSSENKLGKNIPFGVREHAMSAIANGIALHGGLKTFASTFLIFSDYMKYGIRQSALMDLPVLYIFSHDSIYIGEDGPSHQPVEQISSLRLLPNLLVFRPADSKEVVAGFKLAGMHTGPTALILSRQKLPLLKASSTEKAMMGGYVASKEQKTLKITLIASGSEVFLCLQAQEILENAGIGTRVVSMPSMETFLVQSKTYQNSVLPKTCKAKIAVTVGATPLWSQFVGSDGIVMGINNFGESGKGEEIADLFKITAKEIVKNAKKLVKKAWFQAFLFFNLFTFLLWFSRAFKANCLFSECNAVLVCAKTCCFGSLFFKFWVNFGKNCKICGNKFNKVVELSSEKNGVLCCFVVLIGWNFSNFFIKSPFIFVNIID